MTVFDINTRPTRAIDGIVSAEIRWLFLSVFGFAMLCAWPLLWIGPVGPAAPEVMVLRLCFSGGFMLSGLLCLALRPVRNA